MSFIGKAMENNATVCVDGICGKDAVNATGLTPDQDSINGVTASLVTNLIIGSACMFGFLVLRTFMKQYQLRSILPQITVPPPALPRDTFIHKVFGWLVPVFLKSDAYILRAAGLDALVLQKIHAVGFQICIPLAAIGCAFVLPLQMREAFIQGDSSYGRLTAANIRTGSPVMWAHCVMLFVMLAWIFALLEFHTREYATVRQHYLKGSDDPNQWRDLHMAEADGTLVHRQSKMLAVIGEMRHEQDLEEIMAELEETVTKRTWWRRAMISLTSWTGQESAESASLLGSSLLHSKSKKKLKQQQEKQQQQQQQGRQLSEVQEDTSGRLHIDLASDLIQGDFVRDAKLRSQASSPVTTEPTPPSAPGTAAAPGGSSLKSLASMAPKKDDDAAAVAGRAGSPFAAAASKAAAADEASAFAAPRADCDLEAEEISNLVTHKWWTQVEHVSAADGKLRKLTAEEQEVEAVKKVMLAKPSVRYRKTINAIDDRGRRSAVNAQQYAVLVTNVNFPCYPEYNMLPENVHPGAGMCGNLEKGAVPAAVKYELEGPLHGHAEDLPALHKRQSSSKHFDPTRSARVSEGGAGAPVSGGTPSALSPAGSSKLGANGSSKAAAGDVEMGLASAGVRDGDKSHVARPHFQEHRKDITSSALTAVDSKEGGKDAHATGQDAGSTHRQRSGAELWALVRQFAADKKTPGRSLYLLSRDKEFSLVGHVFSQLFPEDYDRCVPVFNFRRVDLLMRKYDNLQGRLEAAEWKMRRTGKRPMMKTKCFGGEQIDAIDWMKDHINRLEDAILMERDAALVYGQTPSWFVLFRSQKAAAIAASCNILPMNQDLFQVHPAPGPEEVNWESLWFNHGQRRLRQFMTTPFAILVVFAPVSLLTSAISQLNSTFCTAVKFEFYCSGKSAVSKVVRGLVTGFLPSLLIILWQGLCMPRLVYLVAQSEGRHFSLSSVDRRMGELYFYWDIFNMFAQGVLGSAAVSAASGSAALKKSGELINAPQKIPQIIGEALPASSKFFFTYVIMRTFMSVPLRFLITQPGVWQSWLRLCDIFSNPKNVPPRMRFMRYAIRSPRYGVEYGSTLLILLISLAFALISPLIVLFGAAFCGGMWVYWRYQLMYNYQRKYESGGLMWHFFVNRVLVCCAVMAAFTGCVLIIKQGFVQAAIIWLFGIVWTIAFAGHLNRKYMNAIVEQPLFLANKAPRARVPSSIYVPPPLQANGLGWYPEFNKCWEWFGMPGYSF